MSSNVIPPQQQAVKQRLASGIDHEIKKLKASFADRLQENRPVSHSVATAYRLTIQNCEKLKKTL